MKRKHMIALGIGIFALVVMTASASALIANGMFRSDAPAIHKTAQVHKKENISWNEAQAQRAVPRCDDGNIVGKVVGGVGGGVAGSQIGSGNGKTAATIGGTLGGAYLGGEYLPTHNVTCR